MELVMDMRTRQRAGYLFLLALSAAAVLVVYPMVHRPAVLLHRAEILSREGRIPESDALILQAVEVGGRRPAAVLRAVRIYLEEGRADRGVTLLGETLDQMKTIPPGLAGRMAGLLDTFGEPGAALGILLRTPPDRRDRSERLYLADLLRRGARYEEALKEYDVLLAADASDAEAALRQAETLAWMGDLDAALPLARALAEARPADRAARLLLARILNWSGRRDEAETEYKRLLGELP
jgi:tetratricopeptide (TPR) repeat protein